MESTELVKTVLADMIESAGKDGVTEGQALKELSKHGLDFRTALDSLEKHYKAAGAERHAGAVVYYRKAEPKPEKKESAAQKLAKESGKRAVGEKQFDNILSNYRR